MVATTSEVHITGVASARAIAADLVNALLTYGPSAIGLMSQGDEVNRSFRRRLVQVYCNAVQQAHVVCNHWRVCAMQVVTSDAYQYEGEWQTPITR